MQCREVLNRLSQRDDAFCEPLAGCRESSCKFRSGSQCRACLPRSCVIPRLENGPQSLRIALSPAACERGIVVDENVWTIRDRPSFKDSVEKNEELTILVSGGIEIFFVRARELPIVKERVCVPFRLWIGVKSGRQGRGNRGGIRPKLNVQKVGGIIPGRRRVQCRFPFWGQRVIEAF